MLEPGYDGKRSVEGGMREEKYHSFQRDNDNSGEVVNVDDKKEEGEFESENEVGKIVVGE